MKKNRERAESKSMNYRLDIEYDGSRYEGWQRQNRTTNTIQGKIEEVLLENVVKPQYEIDGAGRTDAGVHAKGQVAKCPSGNRKKLARKSVST